MSPAGTPMMGGYAADDPSHTGPPGPNQGGGNYFNNFFTQDSSKIEGIMSEGENVRLYKGNFLCRVDLSKLGSAAFSLRGRLSGVLWSGGESSHL